MLGVKNLLITLACLIGYTSTLYAEERKVVYEGYTLWLDCERRSAIRFEYTIGKDTGDEERGKYKLDDSLGDCKQLSKLSYWKESNETYQNGHLVAFNHLDYSPESAADANYMANILPQHKALNQEAWKVTEEITECFREFGTLRVVGGAIWDDDTRMLEVHGVDIPDYFWKVIIRDDESIAWIMPNDSTATSKALDNFIVSLQEIHQRTGYAFPERLERSQSAQPDSWDKKECDRLGLINWQS